MHTAPRQTCHLSLIAGLIVAAGCAGTPEHPVPRIEQADAVDAVELAIALRGGYRPPRTSFGGDLATSGVGQKAVPDPGSLDGLRTVSLALRQGRASADQRALAAFSGHCEQRGGKWLAEDRVEPQLTGLLSFSQAHLVRVGNAVYLAGHRRRTSLPQDAFHAEFRDRPQGYLCVRGEAPLFGVHLYPHRRHLFFSPVDVAGALVSNYHELMVFVVENDAGLDRDAFLDAREQRYRDNYVTHWAAEFAGGLRMLDVQLIEPESDRP